MVTELRSILERFTKALSCIDQCWISDETLDSRKAASASADRQDQSRGDRFQHSTYAPRDSSDPGPVSLAGRVHCFPVGCPGSGLRRNGLPVATSSLRPEEASRTKLSRFCLPCDHHSLPVQPPQPADGSGIIEMPRLAGCQAMLSQHAWLGRWRDTSQLSEPKNGPTFHAAHRKHNAGHNAGPIRRFDPRASAQH